MKIKSTIKERIVSGIVYLSLYTIIGVFVGGFVYFYYGKNSKFMKFHTTQAGFLLFLTYLRGFIILYFEPKASFWFYIPTNPVLMILSGALNILILILAISAFAGKNYRITKIFDFLRK